jgi:hypothetical protein
MCLPCLLAHSQASVTESPGLPPATREPKMTNTLENTPINARRAPNAQRKWSVVS